RAINHNKKQPRSHAIIVIKLSFPKLLFRLTPRPVENPNKIRSFKICNAFYLDHGYNAAAFI
ncbi:hypothetical protein CWB71_20800, partial [Pseudoalteromonas sp. S983]